MPLDRLVVMIKELRTDVGLRVEVAIDDTQLLKLTFSGNSRRGLPLQRDIRDIPGEVVRRVWNENLRDYEVVHRRGDDA